MRLLKPYHSRPTQVNEGYIQVRKVERMNYKIIESINDLDDFISNLTQTDVVGLDVETSSLDPLTCKPYLLQLLINDTIYVFNLLVFRELKYIVCLLENKICVGHNVKYDIEVLRVATGVLLRNVYDTMVGEVITSLDPTKRYYALDDLILKYFNKQLDKTIRESFYNNGILTNITMEQMIYSMEDVQYLLQLREIQLKEVERSRQTRTMQLECDVEPVVARMELAGIKLDVDGWQKLEDDNKSQTLQVRSNTTELLIERTKNLTADNLLAYAEMFKIPVTRVGDKRALEQITDRTYFDSYIRANLNLGSHNQLKAALNLSGIEVESTGAKVLSDLNMSDPILDNIKEYRSLDTLIKSFGHKFIDAINPSDGLLHYQLNQVGTRTGRFSGGGNGINMQQIPRDKRYRSCFMSEEGWKLLCIDYSQQEYRLAGAITGEPLIIQAYLDGHDMHTMTASLVFGVPVSEVTKEQRDRGKSVNFAIIYGSTAAGLAWNFKISLSEAEKIIDAFYGGYPIFKLAKEDFENNIVRCGYASTMIGRRRYFPRPTLFEGGSYQYNKWIADTKKEGFNMMIQGTGSDIVKLSLVDLDRKSPFAEDEFIPLLQVHDEIVVKVRDGIAEQGFEFMRAVMLENEQIFLGDIPAKVDGGIKIRWEH